MATFNAMSAAAMDAIVADLGHAPDHLRVDGERHRFSTKDAKRDDGGWYLARTVGDGLVVTYGDYRTMGNDFAVWRSWERLQGASPPSAEARAQAARDLQAAERNKAEQQADAAKRAQAIWRAATPADPAHPYIRSKGLHTAHGLRQMANGHLVMPLRSVDGQITSLESIDAHGTKWYLPGGAKGGRFHVLGTIEPGKPHYVVEGWATATSVRAGTGRTVIIAADAGNIPAVVDALRAKHPDLHLIHAADAPGEVKPNPQHPDRPIVPVVARVNEYLANTHGIESRIASHGDWNDVHQRSGLLTVHVGLVRAGEQIELDPRAPARAVDHTELVHGAQDFVDDALDDGKRAYVDAVLASMQQGRKQTVDTFPETENFYKHILPTARQHAENLPEGERKDFMRAVARETVERLADGEIIRPARQQSESRRECETRSATA